MRAAVTGASGFVGRFLVTHLRAAGDEVTELARASGFEVTDEESVRAAVAAAKPDVVYHLAARSHVGESWADPAGTFRVNVDGTRHVLRAAALAGTSRVLFVGSAEEYGSVTPAELPLTEESPLKPSTPYAESKVAADELARHAFVDGGLETVRVRPFSHTGPGQSERFVVPALARRIVDAERGGIDEIPVGSLDPVRDVLDVRDVVRAYRLLAVEGEPGEAYNVCSGVGVSIQTIADHLVAWAARPLRLRVDPELVRPVEVPRLVGDASKLRAATGWAPTIPLTQTLADVLAHAREQAEQP
jgi:GDP-4-dehydro-6-deoxy-D-mannose reductase